MCELGVNCEYLHVEGHIMAKRKMIQNNLLKYSIAAYLTAIAIHNKPDFSYRYEIVTFLIKNSWELALKAYVRTILVMHVQDYAKFTMNIKKNVMGILNESETEPVSPIQLTISRI